MEDAVQRVARVVRRHPVLGSVAAVWGLMEMAHYIYFRVRLRRVQRYNAGPSTTREQRLKMLQRLLQAVQTVNKVGDPQEAVRQFLRGWFSDCSFHEIYRENVATWVAAQLFHCIPRQLSPSMCEEVDTCVDHIQDAVGIKLAAGLNTAIKPIRQTMDPVKAWYRPLALYLTISTCTTLFEAWAWTHGFKSLNVGSIHYYHYKPTSASTKQPIVFCHGITPGLLPYARLIRLMATDREVFVLDIAWVAMKLYAPILHPDEFVDTLDILLDRHGVKQACFVGHSYGSMVCNWILKKAPRLIHSLVLLDPVSILLCLPHVASNFLYLRSVRHPRAAYYRSPLELVSIYAMAYVAAREIGVAETLFRNLWWSNDIMFAEDLPPRTTVVLSEADSIVPVRKVRRYLTRYNMRLDPDSAPIEIEWIEGQPHAGFLAHESSLDCVVNTIEGHP